MRASGDRNPELSAPPSDNVYCKNLPGNFSEEQLRALFGTYGTVVQCKILHKSETEQGAGALVRMMDVEGATQAITHLHNLRLPGSTMPLIVRYADGVEQKAQKQARQRRQLQRLGQFGAGGLPGMPDISGEGSSGSFVSMTSADLATTSAMLQLQAGAQAGPSADLGYQAGTSYAHQAGLDPGLVGAVPGAYVQPVPGVCSIYVKHLPEQVG